MAAMMALKWLSGFRNRDGISKEILSLPHYDGARLLRSRQLSEAAQLVKGEHVAAEYAKVCTSAARKTVGHPLRRARAEPSAKVWLPRFVRIRRTSIQGRVAAGTGRWDGEPQAEGRELHAGARLELGEGAFSLPLECSTG